MKRLLMGAPADEVASRDSLANPEALDWFAGLDHRRTANFRHDAPSEHLRSKVQLRRTNCARTRESVSVQLDDELPELELDRLETHLLICPECSAWAEQVRDVTAQLRAAPLEEPTVGRLRPAAVRAQLANQLRRGGRLGGGRGRDDVLRSGASRVSRACTRVSGFVGVAGQHFAVSRLGRLEDGVYLARGLVASRLPARLTHLRPRSQGLLTKPAPQSSNNVTDAPSGASERVGAAVRGSGRAPNGGYIQCIDGSGSSLQRSPPCSAWPALLPR